MAAEIVRPVAGEAASPLVEPPADPIQPQTIQIDLEELSGGARPELNVRLQSGDVLYVPRRRANNFFVVGDVIVPGTYTLPRYGSITATQALIYAGGPLPTAKTSSGLARRFARVSRPSRALS